METMVFFMVTTNCKAPAIAKPAKTRGLVA
jgi:hypothetical protein